MSSITGNLNSTASLNGVQRGLNFTVQAPPDFTVAVSPNSQIADYGGQAPSKTGDAMTSGTRLPLLPESGSASV